MAPAGGPGGGGLRPGRADGAALAALASRVAGAAGPDRALDGALADLLWFRRPSGEAAIAHALAEDALLPFSTRRGAEPRVPRLTSDPDAVRALAARRGLAIERGPDGSWVAWRPGSVARHAGRGATDALAACAAVVATEVEGDGDVLPRREE